MIDFLIYAGPGIAFFCLLFIWTLIVLRKMHGKSSKRPVGGIKMFLHKELGGKIGIDLNLHDVQEIRYTKPRMERGGREMTNEIIIRLKDGFEIQLDLFGIDLKPKLEKQD